MTPAELRTGITQLGLGLNQFALLLGVSARSVSRWITDGEEVPGPVEAYLRVLARLSLAERVTEISRATEWSFGMHDGMYHLSYRGVTGPGQGSILLQRGRLTGADTVGGQYDGSYALSPDQRMSFFRVRMTLPPNTTLVTGFHSVEGGSFDIEFQVPAFSRVWEGTLEVPGGQVAVGLQLMRAMAA